MIDRPADAKDFDFLVGSWSVHNKFLKERLNNCEEWIEFEADFQNRPILHGLGNIDQFNTELKGAPFEGVSLRLFNPQTNLWAIYWMDTNNPRLEDPMLGKFIDGRGEFFSSEMFQGREVRVRFIWIQQDVDHARWEQAFSDDEGETWETNWIMEFTRHDA